MSQEPDVARVAAAMNTPGLKYRSFGNLPVRTESPRGEAASLAPKDVLRELRAASAATRGATADAAAAEQTSFVVQAVPVEDTVTSFAPPPAPRFNPAAPAASAQPAPGFAFKAPTLSLPPAPAFAPPPARVMVAVQAMAPGRPAPGPLPQPVMHAPVTAVAQPPPAPTHAPPPVMSTPILAVAPPPPALAVALPPVMSAPVLSAPVLSAPVLSAPVLSAPVLSAPALAVAPPPPAPSIVPPPVMSAPAHAVAPPPLARAVPEPRSAAPQPVSFMAEPAPFTTQPQPDEASHSIFAQLRDMSSDVEGAAAVGGGVDWAALSAPAQPLPRNPPIAELGLFAEFRNKPVAPLTAVPTASAVPEEFALFQALGPAREAPLPAPPAPAGSTLSRLKQVVSHPNAASLPEPMSVRAPREGASGMWSRLAAGSLPAAAVTVPLGEVMRLVATGGPPAVSPFDTFRAALRAPSTF